MNELLLTPGVISIGITIIGIIIKPAVDAAITLIKSKKDEVEQSKLIKDHQQQISIAKEIWGIVNEHFRVTKTIEDVIQDKIKMFDDMILKKIPGLTQENIDYLRQTIAGEVNKDKQALQDDKVKQLQEQLQNELNSKAKIQSENEKLKQTLLTIQAQAVINPIVQQ